MTEMVFDALVIGSGAAGSFAARELTAQGLRVVQLEAGPEIGPGHFDATKNPRQTEINLWQRAKATALGQAIQARAAFFDGRMRRLFVSDRQNPYSTPPDAPFLWIRGRQAGGRTHTFGRVLVRWTDDDFKMQSRTGKGVDWPIDYRELEPFYEEVERVLELYGQVEGAPTMPDSIYAHRSELTEAERLFKQAVETRWPERRVVTWRYLGPEPTRVLKPMRDALASGRLAIRYDTIASKVLTDDSGVRAVGAEVINARTGQVETLRARSVVVCASPIESVRLLLNSASPHHPTGLANSSGTLGRYFMDQIPVVAAGVFPATRGASTADTAPADPFYRPSGGIFLPRFIGPDGASGTGDFAFQGTVGRNQSPASRPSRFSFFGFSAMEPDADNRITLDPRRKDRWGIPIPHIRCKMGAMDAQTARQAMAALEETVEGAGCEVEFVGSPLGLNEKGRGAYPDADWFSRTAFRALFRRTIAMGAAIHETGGARMGSTRTNSVLDGLNRSWDVPNLLVTDASAFAGSGVAGTTLTIMAMTVRACRHLASQLKEGRL
ncbi:Choline dehydrogenase [Kaistia soli DSM 19436]|uniref:Choline dehydrogenase n=1 Tax=Kaistia soli DSM 19436 TaxID=1122133 RepID=A0A1M5C4S8_9HYPH|nr:GMC family oxidoreductase [Kaistia soli]SHF49442.1 Choline dehydrogenase [Kaistia soli DSM 19436]